MTGDQARALEPLISDRGPRGAALSRRRHHRLDPPDHRVRRAGRPQRRRGAPRRARAPVRARRRPDRRRARPAPADRGPVGRQRGRGRGRHHLPAGRRRAVPDAGRGRASTGCSTASWAAVPQGRRRRARHRSPAASTACRRPTARCCSGRRRSTTMTAPTARVDAETLDARVRARHSGWCPRSRREHAIKTFAANRPASDPAYRIAVDADRRRTWCTPPASARPACRPRRRWRSWCAGCWKGWACRWATSGRTRSRALEPLPRLLGHASPEQLFARDPRYGQVICACEQVTAAEIAAAHGMAVPPRSLEGVRKRTRATGGRCQGALCLAGVSFLHSLHAGRAPAADRRLGTGGDAGRGCGRV